MKKNTPPEKRTLGNFSLKNTKSGAGEGFLLLGCMAKACVKGVFFHRHRSSGVTLQSASMISIRKDGFRLSGSELVGSVLRSGSDVIQGFETRRVIVRSLVAPMMIRVPKLSLIVSLLLLVLLSLSLLI